jgi:hypothetical protein
MTSSTNLPIKWPIWVVFWSSQYTRKRSVRGAQVSHDLSQGSMSAFFVSSSEAIWSIGINLIPL